MIQAITGSLLASIAAPAFAQCISANAVEIQIIPVFNQPLRVAADVPSLFASRSHDVFVTLPRTSAATKADSSLHLISQNAVLTTSFATESTGLTKSSSFGFASGMQQDSSVMVSIALPQNVLATDRPEPRSMEVIEVTDYQPTDINNDGFVDFFDYLDFLLAPDSVFDR